ncbi:hypothetical protein RJ639_044887 [Escallonia herrerae]|uniref:Uncharacterized protein n=1 Tax=Escallonia herrerae TaxID=1293975 RepID=A0AA89B2K8_9ASTE|nr:hypothetical protein RJ639_044887 [Escallonia herrerae]
MRQDLSVSQEHGNLRGEILTVWKILDAHFSMVTSKYEWNDVLIDNPIEHSEDVVYQNCIFVDLLVHFWNCWKEEIVILMDYLLCISTQDASVYMEYKEFCLNYFGVQKQTHNKETIYVVLNSDANWKGDLLHQSDLLEKARQFEETSKLKLWYVLAQSLWLPDSKGWPLKQFPHKEEILEKATACAKNKSDTFFTTICTEAEVLSGRRSSLSKMRQDLSVSQEHGNLRGEILTVWKILDAHFSMVASKYEWNDVFIDNPIEHSEDVVSQNCVYVESLPDFEDRVPTVVKVSKRLKSKRAKPEPFLDNLFLQDGKMPQVSLALGAGLALGDQLGVSTAASSVSPFFIGAMMPPGHPAMNRNAPTERADLLIIYSLWEIILSMLRSVMRLYDGWNEILKIQKFRRVVSYTGFYCFAALISYAYTSNTTRAGYSRADQFYASYPAGTELLTDTAKLYKAALGNCFDEEEWGPIEWCVLAKHFERQGKSPYAYHAVSFGDTKLCAYMPSLHFFRLHTSHRVIATFIEYFDVVYGSRRLHIDFRTNYAASCYMVLTKNIEASDVNSIILMK